MTLLSDSIPPMQPFRKKKKKKEPKEKEIVEFKAKRGGKANEAQLELYRQMMINQTSRSGYFYR